MQCSSPPSITVSTGLAVATVLSAHLCVMQYCTLYSVYSVQCYTLYSVCTVYSATHCILCVQCAVWCSTVHTLV